LTEAIKEDPRNDHDIERFENEICNLLVGIIDIRNNDNELVRRFKANKNAKRVCKADIKSIKKTDKRERNRLHDQALENLKTELGKYQMVRNELHGLKYNNCQQPVMNEQRSAVMESK